MKVQKIQSNQSFQARQRFLNPNQLRDVHAVLKKMNEESVYETAENTFSTNLLGAIKINDSAYLYDNRFLAKHCDDMDGQSSLEFRKTKLDFDIKTGEIVKYSKPFFKSWHSIMNQAAEYLNAARKNFDNKYVVDKRFVSLKGLAINSAK